MSRIDTHAHAIPAKYRAALKKDGVDDAGGRELPDWSPGQALAAMADLDVSTAIVSVSVSAPGTTFLPAPAMPPHWLVTSTTTPPRRSPRIPTGTHFLLDTTRAAYLLVRNGIRRAGIPISHSSSATPADSCPTWRIEWR